MIADAFASMLDWRPRAATIENPTFSLNDPAAFRDMFGGAESESGQRVTHTNSISIGAVWQCVSTISGDVAVSTLNTFKVLPDDDRQIDWDHDTQSLVAVQPNAEMSAFDFWRRLMVHALLWGNGYAFIERQGRSSNGRIIGLYNLLPDRTVPLREDDGTLFYGSEVDGKVQSFRSDEILHVKGLSLDGSSGCDPVAYFRECVGLALASQEFGSKFFKNGCISGGILEIPATFTEKAKQVLEEGFDKRTAGKDNQFKTVVLRDGAKFHASTIDAQKSQMHELREDQVRDIARFFVMPPSKVGLSDSVSYSSQEQSQIAYLTGCLNHWFASIRGECNIKLLTPNERMSGNWYFEHNVTKLIEVDTKTMNEVLNIQRTAEVVSADEWRRKIGLNKRPDGKGGEYVNPNTKSNSAPVEPTTQEPAKTDPKKKAAGRQLFCETVNRVARRVCFDAKKESAKPQKFATWLDGKAQEHRPVFADAVRPVLAVVSDDDPEAVSVSIDGVFFGDFLNRLNPLLSPPYVANDLIANVENACSEFEKTIAERLCESVKGIV